MDNDEVVVDMHGIRYDYFEDTLNQFRTTGHAIFDMCLVILIMGLISIGLQLLQVKGYIDTYHYTNIVV